MSDTMLRLAGTAVLMAAMAMPAAAAPVSSMVRSGDLAGSQRQRVEAPREAQRLVPVTLVRDGQVVWSGRLPASRTAVIDLASAITEVPPPPTPPLSSKPVRGQRLICLGAPLIAGGDEEHVYELFDCEPHDNKIH